MYDTITKENVYGQVHFNLYVYCILDSVLQMYQENELWGNLRLGTPPEKCYELWPHIGMTFIKFHWILFILEPKN